VGGVSAATLDAGAENSAASVIHARGFGIFTPLAFLPPFS
jgi:hypothetical protein